MLYVIYWSVTENKKNEVFLFSTENDNDLTKSELILTLQRPAFEWLICISRSSWYPLSLETETLHVSRGNKSVQWPQTSSKGHTKQIEADNIHTSWSPLYTRPETAACLTNDGTYDTQIFPLKTEIGNHCTGPIPDQMMVERGAP